MQILSMQQREELLKIINHFLFLLNNQNDTELANQFGLNKAIVDEMIETLIEHNLLSKKLTLAPQAIVFSSNNEHRPIFDIFAMNTPQQYGIETCIYANNQETDLTLVGQFIFENQKIKFSFQSLGTH